jgi:deoxyribodipyrimidine photo-lyase
MANIIWFRRDLRIADNPALLAALKSSDEIVALFIIDKELSTFPNKKRLAYLAESLKSLDQSLGGNLHVIHGEAADVLKDLVARYKATEVHIAQEYDPRAMARDAKVKAAGINLVTTGSPYAVAPGRVLKESDGTPYKVYTPFYKNWCIHGWRKPAETPKSIAAIKPGKGDRNFPDWPVPAGQTIPPAGEAAALERFKFFKKKALDDYQAQRNIPGVDGTSKLGPALAFGEVHPRTLLAQLGDSQDHDVFRKEIAWREFYADVMFNNPHTDKDYYAPRFKEMRYDKPGKAFLAWCEGKTGFPFVDAAMRQLVQEGWMHNRTRMVVASFLVKDLHLEWQHGAKFFEEHLVDFDVASNAHGWQWTAGTGTDASPYYRVFNPIEQGKKFDGDGAYIRKYVPEIAHLSDKEIHEPWLYLDGYLHNYPERIVDHAIERIESLERLKEIKIELPSQPNS